MAGDQQTHRNDHDYSWMLPIEVMLGSINHKEVQACSISSVSDKLRSPREEAYSPQTVSIGPVHRGTRNNLKLMEQLKWHYKLSLLGRTEKPKEYIVQRLRHSGKAMEDLDNVVRASYGGTINFEPRDLAKIMLLDGCFVLEFLFRLKTHREGNKLADDKFEDPIFSNEQKLLSVLKDLTMLENQIPFIVLKKLYRKIFPDGELAIENDHRVADLALNAFGYNRVRSSGIAHLLHLIHLSTDDPKNKQEKPSKVLKHCATRLRAAGIKIQPARSNPDKNKFVDKFDFEIKMQGEDGSLVIPQLHIKEITEVNWRNLIALEQSLIAVRSKFTSYALFFRSLICCEHDIELLLHNNVIVNHSGMTKEDLLRLFRTITKGVEHVDWGYGELCESLNNKYGSAQVLKKSPVIFWHKCRFTSERIRYYWQNWYDILIRDHIPTVWKLIGVLAATALLVLTIMQTYYAAHQNQK